MKHIDIFRYGSEGNKAHLRELRKSGQKNPKVTTRILEVYVRRPIHRVMILSNDKALKFNPIHSGNYRVREFLDLDGKYGWQFISPKTGMPIGGHNREKFLKNHLVDIEIKSEKIF